MVALVAALQFVYILDFIMVLPLGPRPGARARLSGRPAGRADGRVHAGLAGLRPAGRAPAGPLRAQARAAVRIRRADPGHPGDQSGQQLCGPDRRACPDRVHARAHDCDRHGDRDRHDAIAQQRGRTIARVMLGFSVAALAGVPLALELARAWAGWQAPFAALGMAAVAVWLCAAWLLPNRAAGSQARGTSIGALLRQRLVRQACLVQGLSQFSAFLLVPHFAAYYLLNLDFPRDQLALLYLAGGVCALLAVQLLGRVVDRAGTSTALACASVAMGFGLLPFFAAA
ncbi:MFS transporter [Massilia sp. H-1]|nr:MFS transporter [Massilia sp. H-1]